MDNHQLLPCAFCGCTKVPVRQGNGIGDYWLECSECGASTKLREDGAGNEKDWNRRPAAIAPSDAAGAPIYQNKLKRADSWCDCDKETFDHTAAHPARFDTRILYAAPVAAQAPQLTSEQRGAIQTAADTAQRVLRAGGDYGDELSDVGLRRELTASLLALRALLDAPVAPAAAAPKQVGKNALVLTGAQLLEALDFIAPDRATDPEQMEATVAIEFGEGHGGKAMYVWCAEYPEEGSFVLDGKPASGELMPVNAPGPQPAEREASDE